MSVKHSVHRSLNVVLRSLGERLALKRLPTVLNGHPTFLPRAGWQDVVMRTESYTAQILSEHLTRGGCFWDIGAHHGLMSLQAAWIVGRAGKIVAVEPEPGNFKILQNTLANFRGVTCVNSGVGAKAGQLDFYSNGPVSYGSFINGVTAINLHFATTPEIKTISCPIVTLDALAKEHPAPNLIKVDVEGFEVEVLKGAKGLLADRSTAWLIEVHPVQIEKNRQSPSDVETILRRNGYRPERLEEHRGLYTVFAPPADL